MSHTILCPNCNFEIEVSGALAAQLREQLRKESEAEMRRKELAWAEREETLHQRERTLDDARRSLETELAERLTKEREQILNEARGKAQQAVALEFTDLQMELTAVKDELSRARRAELDLRKERRELEDEKSALELSVQRRLDEERAQIRVETKRLADEEHQLQQADKDKLVADLRRQIDELQRKAEHGCPYVQGEVMELQLEDLLRQQFPTDTIEPIRVGSHGGDVLQHVVDSTGRNCGAILWESKRTKSWSDAWLPKLRDDQRAARAHFAALLSAELPKGMTTFACIDGVWVTSRSCVVGVAAALRAALIEAARTRCALEGKQTKMGVLYEYVAGPEFRQRFDGIVEAFVTMKEDLDSEKRSMHRLWAKREKHLGRAAVNAASLYGDLGGILGPHLPQIANLELAADEIGEPRPALVEESPF